MKLAIPLLVVVGVGIAVIATVRKQPKHSESTDGKSRSPRLELQSVPADIIPDGPRPFGYKCMWFAVKTANAEDVITTIGLRSPIRSNWKSGIEAAYGSQIFISPPVSGWTLIVGQGLPTLDDSERKKTTENLVVRLSQKFGDVQHFGTHRVVEFHAWVKASNGKIVREYAYLGESGEVLSDVGEKTKEETDAGIGGGPNYSPSEDDVMKVAEKWSINPTKLNAESAPLGVGWLGTL